MNINPISFGRIARVNAPYCVAKQVVELINQPEVDRKQPRVQEDLKELFYDYRYGAALLVEPRKDEFYIMSGDDASKARLAKEKMEDSVICACADTDCLEACEHEAECVEEYRDELYRIIGGLSDFPSEYNEEDMTEEEFKSYLEAFGSKRARIEETMHPTLDIEYGDDLEITDLSLHFEE